MCVSVLISSLTLVRKKSCHCIQPEKVRKFLRWHESENVVLINLCAQPKIRVFRLLFEVLGLSSTLYSMSPLKLSWPISIALAVVAGLLALLPFTMSLVDQAHRALDGGGLAKALESTEATLFLRTRSTSLVNSVLRALDDEPVLTLSSDDQYEWALLSTASGTTWVLSVTDVRGQILSLQTPQGLVSTLPEPASPLSRLPSFRQSIRRSSADTLWVQPGVLPGSPLLRSLLAPMDALTVSIQPDGAHGQAVLSGVRVSQPGDVRTVAGDGRDGLVLQGVFSLSPALAESVFALRDLDEPSFTGLRGVLLALVHRITGSTDLDALLAAIGQKPLFLSIARTRGTYDVFLSGSMRSGSEVQRWMDLVRSTHAAGSVRTVDLLGQQRHTDIVQDPTSTLQTEGEWQIADAGEGYTVATRDMQFVIGSRELVTQAIEEDRFYRSATVIDLEWAATALGVPSSLVPELLGKAKSTLSWGRTPNESTPTYDWALQ